MTMVCPFGVTTTVSAERLAMTGALTLLGDRHGLIGQRGNLRRHDHLDGAPVGDERRDAQDDADVVVLDRVDRLAGVRIRLLVMNGTSEPTTMTAS